MLNKIRKLREKKGFTLVELIVVIAIIAILTAVIVPLVGRYSAQATYTTLNDAATTISSSTNTALSSATQMGSVSLSTYFIGKKTVEDGKTDSTLVVTSSTGKSATATIKTNAVPEEGLVTLTDIDEKACALLADALFATLPNNCAFYVAVKSNAVTGVVYTTDSAGSKNLAELKTDPTGFERDKDFDNAYKYKFKVDSDEKTCTVGLSGKFIPPIPTTTTAAPNPNPNPNS